MHELGFEVVTKKKGTFSDGHEREDVTEYRKLFLRKMVGLGFLNPSNAPTEEAKKVLPNDLEPPPAEIIHKTVLIFHDETTFQANRQFLGLLREQMSSGRSQKEVALWSQISSLKGIGTWH